MAMAIAAALIVLTACFALIRYADSTVDEAMAQRESRLIASSVQHELMEVEEDVRPPTVWSEAYEILVRRPDWMWIHLNYGDNFQRFRGHSVTYIVDGRNRPVYASEAATIVNPASITDFVAASRGLVIAARAKEADRLAKTPKAVGLAREVSTAAGVRVGPRVYIASAATIVPEEGYTGVIEAGPSPMVITAVEVNAEMLDELHHEFGLKDAKLLLTPPFKPLAVPLRDADGKVIAAFTSTPERPVHGVFQRARWQIASLSIVVIGVVGFLIYSLRRLARSLAQARDRAEAGDRAKSEFIANMSHEIRTPLNGVLGMAQVMETHELSAAQRDRLRVMRESGAALLTLLNELLDFAKIEAGRLEIEAGAFDLEPLVRQVTATFEGMAGAKGLELTAAVSAEARGAWVGDALRIRQVLSNLVSNAVKFTDRGGVTLSATTDEQGLRFRVVDTGIGLTEAQIPGLFDKFIQADASTTRRYGGTGLGLSIVRALVELMGGAVSVDSRPGEGAAFTVRLPLARASEAPAAAPEPIVAAPERRLRVLAAEDNPTNQLVLAALLEPIAAELTLVGNGRDAVEAFAAGGFDVILMDVQMPELNGVDATRAIRVLEAQGGAARTPVIALTANVMGHQLELYRAAGMDGHIAKPVQIAELYAALEMVLPEGAEELAA
jgi:signal transduction histidine kinase